MTHLTKLRLAWFGGWLMVCYHLAIATVYFYCHGSIINLLTAGISFSALPVQLFLNVKIGQKISWWKNEIREAEADPFTGQQKLRFLRRKKII